MVNQSLASSRFLALAAVFMLLACSPFTNDREELAYLRSLSNPSPEQWKRKNELNRSISIEDRLLENQREAEDEIRDREAQKAAFDNAAAEEVAKRKDAIATAFRLAEQNVAAKEYGVAASHYQGIVKDFPLAPEAIQAAKLAAEFRRLAYGED